MRDEDHNTMTISAIIFAVLFFLGAMALGAGFWAAGFSTFLGAFIGLFVGAWALRVTGRIR